ncbi:MAG: CBS domain-containing protein, partial [Planctomycetota bacterium]
QLTDGVLILREFLPAAHTGLARAGVLEADATRFLGVIERRVTTRHTGANWVLRSVAKMRGVATQGARLASLTRAMLEHQAGERPVHEWAEAPTPEGAPPHAFARVSQCMTTELFTVGEDDCIDLAASIMDWERVRHIPVEDNKHRLVGLISYRKLLRVLSRGDAHRDTAAIPVSEIMERKPVTITPDTPTLDAIRIMSEHRVSCLPVVEDERLVGIISERDYASIAGALLERALGGDRDA